jgi:hypothetical protein
MNNDLQLISKEALIAQSSNATRPFGRAASSRRRRLYESDAMNALFKNRGVSFPRSSRGDEALTHFRFLISDFRFGFEPPHVGCYSFERDLEELIL